MNESQLFALRTICGDITTLYRLSTTYINFNGQVEASAINEFTPSALTEYFDRFMLKIIYSRQYDNGFAILPIDQYDLNLIVVPVRISGTLEGYLILGPYLVKDPTNIRLQDIIFRMNIPSSVQHAFRQFYLSLEVYTENRLVAAIRSLKRMLATLSLPYSEFDIDVRLKHMELAESEPQRFNLNTIKEQFDLIEERYRLENKLYDAVKKGDYETARNINFDNHFMSQLLERVPNNPFRSHKNLFFVFNALLRKSAESGGVHPYYTDSISGKYAVLIENLTRLSQSGDIAKQMIFEYCELVRTHSTKAYSSAISKIIEYIRFNIDREINLNELSQLLNMSPSNISRKFKVEVGETMTGYINRIRIEEAIRLMSMKRYNLTQIALQVGYSDINYFTRVFKKQMNVTPSKYMETEDLTQS